MINDHLISHCILEDMITVIMQLVIVIMKLIMVIMPHDIVPRYDVPCWITLPASLLCIEHRYPAEKR